MYKTPIHILLVEDSPSDATLLRQILSRSGKEGWEVVHVERLFDAIDACTGAMDCVACNCALTHFDVVLLDLSLPDSDGLETVAEFHAAAPNIPIVVLTGSDDEELALEAVAIGAQDYLVKDQITAQLLVRAIRYAIERGQILRQLQESEQRFRGIFEQTFQSMRLLTPEGVVLEVNQTALDLSGTTEKDCVGKQLWNIKPWNESGETQEWLKTAVAKATEGEFVRGEVELCKALDERVWVDVSLKPLTDERGNVILLILEGRDISDRKRAEAETLKALEKERELNQLKSKFVSMVSHEFRNPMTTIRAAADLLQDFNDQLSQEKKVSYFCMIQSSINHMLHLLDDILLLGSTEVGKLQYQPAPLDLEKFCRHLTDSLALSTSSQHKITLTYLGKSTQVEMDEALLQHILSNLLSNAIKYSPQGGNIRFDIISQDDTATFRIQDEGIGIPLKDQNRLFETFHRASNVTGIQGTGLGLAIVKKSVELHGGEIEVKSQVGMGTTFTVTLPLNQHSSFQLPLKRGEQAQYL